MNISKYTSRVLAHRWQSLLSMISLLYFQIILCIRPPADRLQGNSNMAARCTSSSSPLLRMLLLMLLGVSMVMTMSASGTRPRHELSSFCDDACRRGSGGNACQCSIAKFAGKRSRTSPLFPPFYDGLAGGSLGRSSGRGTMIRHRVTSPLHSDDLFDMLRQAASRWVDDRLQTHSDTTDATNYHQPNLNV